MSNHKHYLKKLVAWLSMVAIITGTMVVTAVPVASAATTSSITSITFNSAGLAALRDNMVVTFTEPVCGDTDCTEGLSISNFVYIDGGGAAQTIASVTHTVGTNWALLTMSADFEASDTSSSIRVEEVHTISGMQIKTTSVDQLVADTTAPTITTKGIKDGTDSLLLGFSEPVGDEAGNILAHATDFIYGNDEAGNATALDLTTVSGDRRWVTLSTDANVAAGDHADATDDYITIVDDKLYDLVGNEIAVPAPAAEIDLSTFTPDSTIPTISSAYGRIGNDTTGGNDALFLTFSEPVFSAATGTGNLAAADFVHSTDTVSTATHTAGSNVAILDLDANQTAMGTIDSEAGDDDVYDAFGNALTGATAAVTIDDNTSPVLIGVWINQHIEHGSTAPTAIGGGTGTSVRVTSEATVAYPQEEAKMMRWTDGAIVDGVDGFMFDQNVDLYDVTNGLAEFTQVKFDIYYEDNSANVNFTDDDDLSFVINNAADFTTASEWDITTDINEKTWTTVTVDLTAAVSSGTALSAQAANPQFWGIQANGTTELANDDVLYVDNIRFSRGASSKSNMITLEYSEAVDLTGDPAEGASGASTTTAGDMTTDKTLAGMGAFASGTFTTKTLTNNLDKSADGTTYSVSLADGAAGLITSASPVTVSGLFTPTANVTDIDGNAISTSSVFTPETVIDTLDVTTAASAMTGFGVQTSGDGVLRAEWTPPAQTSFSHYVVTYGTSTGVTVASSLWDDSDDATLATATTGSTLVSGLSNDTTYYLKGAGVDIKGIPTALSSEVAIAASGSSGGGGSASAMGAPLELAATVDADNQVVLTWTDPTSSSLDTVKIFRGISPLPVDGGAAYAMVDAGLETYTDTTVTVGDTVSYVLKGYTSSGGAGSVSDTLTITVEADAVADVTETTVDPTPDETTPTEDTETSETITTSDAPLTYEEEKTMAQELGIVTIDIDKPTNKCEALVMLSRAAEWDVDTTVTEDGFTDTPDWCKPYAKYAKDNGVVSGRSEGVLGAEGEVSRYEIAMMLATALGATEADLEAAADSSLYSDEVADWALGAVSWLNTEDVLRGYPDGTFQGAQSMLKIELAVAVGRAFGLFETEVPMTSYDVKVSNISDYTLSPGLVVVHNESVSLAYEGLVVGADDGAPASLEALAEGGDTSGLKALLEGMEGVKAVHDFGPVLTTEMETVTVSVEEGTEEGLMISVLSMVVDSNDGYVYASGPLAAWTEVVTAANLDAGTEVNADLGGSCANGQPGAECLEDEMGTPEDPYAAVSSHDQLVDPVAEVKVM